MNWKPNPGHRPKELKDSDKVHVRFVIPPKGEIKERTVPVKDRDRALYWGKDCPVYFDEWAKA